MAGSTATYAAADGQLAQASDDDQRPPVDHALGTAAATPLRPVAAMCKCSQRFARAVASLVNKGRDMNRLDNIATRQRKSFARDVLFAMLVVVAGAVSLSSVTVAAHAAHADVARR